MTDLTNAMAQDDKSTPIAEADPRSLDILLSAAPESWTDGEFIAIIEALRTQRKNWLIEEMAEKKTKSKAAKTPKIAAPAGLSIDDLGLV